MPTPTRFGDLEGPYGELVTDLTNGKVTARYPCHLDPDIAEAALPRGSGWRGALGQVAAAQGHLRKQGVQAGDLFIFWGLFRPVKYSDRWRFIGEREHRIWGWLQIGEIIELGADGSHVLAERPWLKDHPHTRAGWGAQNVLYIATKKLTLGSQVLPLDGSGILKKGYRLSKPGAGLSTWRVPDWLHLLRGGSGMTYHPPDRWNEDGTVHAAARGQEFVAVVQNDGKAIEWITALVSETPK